MSEPRMLPLLPDSTISFILHWMSLIQSSMQLSFPLNSNTNHYHFTIQTSDSIMFLHLKSRPILALSVMSRQVIQQKRKKEKQYWATAALNLILIT